MISITYDEIKREFNDQTMQGIYETEVVLGEWLYVRAVEHGGRVKKIPMDLQRNLTSAERNKIHALVGDQEACAVVGNLNKAVILTEPKGKNILTTIVYDVVLENNDVINPYFIEGHILLPEVYENEKLPEDVLESLYLAQHKLGCDTAETILNEIADKLF